MVNPFPMMTEFQSAARKKLIIRGGNMSYIYLKLHDKTLLAYDRENAEYKVYENALLPFTLRDSVKDTTELFESDKYRAAIKNSEQLTKFFTERSLSINRENAKFILNELGISQKNMNTLTED